MFRVPKLRNELKEWQEDLLDSYQHGRTIHFKRVIERVAIAYSEDPPAGRRKESVRRKFHGMLPRVKAIVVGLDIREYSRRKAEQQLFLTMNLHVCIGKAIRLLKRALILPEHEPLIIIQTGDGAYVVFTLVEAYDPFSKPAEVVNIAEKKEETKVEAMVKRILHLHDWTEDDWKPVGKAYGESVKQRQESESRYLPTAAGQAMSFIFALNSIMNSDNARQGFVADASKSGEASDGFPVFPAECRFAVSYDEVLLLYDVNDKLNCVGNGMVTCARILSTDHGNHLLMDHELLKGLERHGGLGSLCAGQWGHRLHSALLNDVKVKSGQFRYADVFGFYHDGPMLQALRRLHQKPVLYHIGSHNVSSIDSV